MAFFEKELICMNGSVCKNHTPVFVWKLIRIFVFAILVGARF